MRNLLPVLGTTAILTVFAIAPVVAQSTDFDQADASATIVAAIAITNTSDLDFGEVVPGTSTGTVVMSTAGLRSAFGGTTLGSEGSASAAGFDVSGADGYAFSITLPESIELESGEDAMTVDAFTSDPDASSTLADGARAVAVGATLNVGANQAEGVYSGSFDVTVDYN